MADAMLGWLARWLRFIGCDVAFDAAIDDADLVRRALDEERIALTRDRALLKEWSLPRVLLVEPETLPEQQRLVVETFDIDWHRGLFTRCSR